MSNYQKYLNYLVIWLKKEVKKANKKGVIWGLSGGVDSALLAVIAKQAFPKNHLAVIMPCDPNFPKRTLCNQLISKFSLKYQYVNFQQEFTSLLTKLQDNKINQDTQNNSKPRLRMVILYLLAQTYNYLVLGSCNADEWYLGYFTKYGDNACDLMPLIHLHKNEIKTLAKMVKIPTQIIAQPPSADLSLNQTDEQDFQFKYQDLNKYYQNQLLANTIKTKILSRHNNNEHKRKLPKKPNKKLSMTICKTLK